MIKREKSTNLPAHSKLLRPDSSNTQVTLSLQMEVEKTIGYQ